MTGPTADYFAINRANWDERVGIHLKDTRGIYRIDDLRRGEDVLGPIESVEIGDINGKRILHLQCHFGVDTICLSRRGAAMTAVDFSPVAIREARALATEIGEDIRFIEGNVYDAVALTGGGFDGVFTSWGTIGWLPDIGRWGEVIRDCLAPGGFFYIADAHPTLYTLEEREAGLMVEWDWRTPPDRPIKEDYSDTYAGDGTPVKNSLSYGWNHPLSDIFNALTHAGLRIDRFREHEMIPWQAFPSMRREGTQFVQADDQVKVPLAFSLRATKPQGER